MDPFSMVAVIVVATTAGAMYRSYVKNRAEERKQQAPAVPADVHERLARIEARLAEMSEEQRQLRTELDWQAKLLQQPPEK